MPRQLTFPGMESEASRIFPGLPLGGFDFIMADPAWEYTTRSPKGQAKSPQRHYRCMSLAEIKALPVQALAARHSCLLLWVPNAHLPQAFEVMDAWGFKFSTAGTWVKLTKRGKLHFGTGYTLRGACEPFLIGLRGSPKHSRGHRNVIMGEAREHSRKPEAAYKWAETYMPDADRLDMFSRQTRPRWTAWGNEAGKFDDGQRELFGEAS